MGLAEWFHAAMDWLQAQKEIIGVLQGLLSSLAIIAALIRFLLQTKFKQRVRFDLGCKFIYLKSNPKIVIAEVQFIFKNTGFVEHRLYDLQVAIHGLLDESKLKSKATGELIFERRLLPLTPVLPQTLSYFFVRPGVRQVITHTCAFDSPGAVIRVTASFSYRLSPANVHYARRVFKVPEPD